MSFGAVRRISTRVWIAIGALGLVIGATAWIAIQATNARSHLDNLRDDIGRVRADLLANRSATADLRSAQRDARIAHQETHDPVWELTSWVPPVHTVRGLTDAVNDLAAQALPSVVALGTTIEPSKLRIARNQIALAPLEQAAGPLTRADQALARARTQVAGLSGGWGLLSAARTKVLDQLTSLSGSIDDAARFTRVGPAMLGADGPRRYFVGIQNNAESRATGGLVAAYAVITADHGTVRVTERGNDSALINAPALVASLSPDYAALYGGYLPGQTWITSNLSPDFPAAARNWAGLWQAQSGEHIDGVFGVDPYALQAMLGATGPVTVRGYPHPFDGTNLADFIESGEYAAFRGPDQTLRKNYLSTVAGAVLHQLLSGSGDASTIVSALGRTAGEHHLALWSANPTEEAEISGTPLADELPASLQPFASVSVNSGTGTKLDYYLERNLTYRATSCDGPNRQATITVRLDNATPLTHLPRYVRTRGDRHGGTREIVERIPQNALLVAIDGTDGAALEHATLDGRPVRVGSGLENGHPVYSLRVTLDPNVPRTISLQLQEPVAAGRPQTLIQPLARPQRTTLDVPTCS